MSFCRNLCFVFVAACVLQQSAAVEDSLEIKSDDEAQESENIKEMNELIKDFEIAYKAARKVEKKRIRKLDYDIHKLQVESITGTFLELNKLVSRYFYCVKFISLNGVERTILPALDFPDDDVKADALLLLRTIFEVNPEHARNEMPDEVLEKVITTFQQVGSFPVKKRTLDIINIWLPRNPVVQAKIIKMKGIEIFYDQLINMDSDAVNIVLNLFKTILEEHLEAMQDIGPRTGKELEVVKEYEAVGLLNHISKKKICNGVAELLDNVWVDKETHIPLVCDLLKIMKPFCLKKLKGKYNYLQNFEEIENFIDNDSNKNSFVNATEMKLLVKAYKDVIAGKRTEL